MLDGYYDSKHKDHIHVDVSTGVRFSKNSDSDTKFLQASCNAFAGAPLHMRAQHATPRRTMCWYLTCICMSNAKQTMLPPMCHTHLDMGNMLL